MAFLAKNLEVMTQVRRIKKALNGVVDKARGPIGDVLLTQAALIASEQRSLVAVGDDANAGALKESIRVEEGKETAKKAVVVNIKAGGPTTTKGGYDYARAVEFGTQDVPAQPFFFPVWRARRKDVRKVTKKAVKQVVRSVFK